MKCNKCDEVFIQIGQSKTCGRCRLDSNKTPRAERMRRITSWMEERRLEVFWLTEIWARRRGYDGLIEVPDAGVVRVGISYLKEGCEMALGVTAEEMQVVFRCARVSLGTKKAWGKRKKDDGVRWPGGCRCMGCKAKEWFEGCNPTQDVL